MLLPYSANLAAISDVLRNMEAALDEAEGSADMRAHIDPKTLEGVAICDLPRVGWPYQIDRVEGVISMSRGRPQ